MKIDSPYRMLLSSNVLEHIGLNLYSNVPAVLSEVIANAWDADARNVDITLHSSNGKCHKIVIQDDGLGMTRDEINERFLLVGYRWRRGQPGNTPKGRPPMGRKGIGKLSLFSVADEIVFETSREGQKSAFRMCLNEIKGAISRESSVNGVGQYFPDALDTESVDFESGSRITLSGLRKRQTMGTVTALRKRLARRFSIIGDQYGFNVSVNDSPICLTDRGYYDKIQYVWTYGDQSDDGLFPKLDHAENRRSALIEGTGLSINGWLGTVQESKQLRGDGGENLNRVAIFMRGKMAQEDMLRDLTESGVYSSYLIGELRVDGLDTDDGTWSTRDDDIATSSRQSLVEDDPRYVDLREFLRGELKVIESCWSKLRDHDGVAKALKIPQVESWIKDLPEKDAKIAKSWLGKINRISIGDDNERMNLFKHAVIAFEFYRLNQSVDELESLPENDVEATIAAFRKLDILEATLYGQIVRNRIEIIRTLKEKIDKSAKEREIQKYIFDHLWLLDPSWDRVDASEVMESRISSLFDDIHNSMSDAEKRARIDIKYRQSSGKHIIIELKRPDLRISVHDLCKQIGKYRSGMRKILKKQGLRHQPVEFVCLLGEELIESSQEDGEDLVAGTLETYGARYVNYDQLLNNAYKAYDDYLKSTKQVNRLSDVIEAIDNFSATSI